jgi:hypothetical protein
MTRQPTLHRRNFMALLAAVPLAACAGRADDDDAQSGAITDIPRTAVKRELIPNCWSYAVCAWIESMHMAQGGAALDLSESYLSYMELFGRIVGMVDIVSFDELAIPLGPDATVYTGLNPGRGVYLATHFGLRKEAAFPVQIDGALSSVQKELQTGRLKTQASRRDGELVRRVLDEAFQLEQGLRDQLDALFGKGLERERDRHKLLPENEGWIDPRSLPIAKLKSGDNGPVFLSEIVYPGSVMRSDHEVKVRWTDSPRPTDGLRSILGMLHAGWSVPLSWGVDARAGAARARYDVPTVGPTKIGHASLLIDYQATLPGHGTIPVGTKVTDPGILTALERGEGTIEFFRVKNSWGTDFGTGAGQEPGFTDLTPEYLASPDALLSVFAPSAGEWLYHFGH